MFVHMTREPPIANVPSLWDPYNRPFGLATRLLGALVMTQDAYSNGLRGIVILCLVGSTSSSPLKLLVLGGGKRALAGVGAVVAGAFHFRGAVQGSGILRLGGVGAEAELDLVAFDCAGERGVAELAVIHSAQFLPVLLELKIRTA